MVGVASVQYAGPSLTAFVADASGAFGQDHRLRKPCRITGYVGGWAAFRRPPAGEADDARWAAPSHEGGDAFGVLAAAVGRDTPVHCLFAHDGVHFFANQLCEKVSLAAPALLRPRSHTPPRSAMSRSATTSWMRASSSAARRGCMPA